jgi:hypothetical protein
MLSMDFTKFTSLHDIFNNKLLRIIFAILFYVFILNIIYQFGVFIGVNKNILDMYYIWVAILVLLITILPIKRSNL